MAVDRKALAELTKQMRRLNLPDPEDAAREELETGAPILATYSFLKWLTDKMVRRGDTQWIQSASKRREANPRLAEVLDRLLAAGAERDDLTSLVRIMQFAICEHACFMLDQVALPGSVPVQDFAVYHVGGGSSLEDGKPIARLTALHEEIGAWDPSQEDDED